MIIKYRTRSWYTVDRIEIAKETAKFVVYPNGRRDSKISEYYRYYDTFDEAKEYLIERIEQAIRDSESKIQRLSGDLEKVKVLTEAKHDN